MRAGFLEVGLTLGIDEGGGAVGESVGRVGGRRGAVRLKENGPAGAEAPEGVVETAGDSDQRSRHGAVEVGPAEACGALQAAVLGEDNAFADQCDPGEEVGEPSIAVAIFCEVHHRRRSSDRQVTGNAQMLAHDVDELRIALGRPDGGEMADGPEAERSEEHTSELQSLMRISYAVFCLKKKKNEN